MSHIEWSMFLQLVSQHVLSDPDRAAALPIEMRTSGWIGYPPITPRELVIAEQRLCTKLPPSYREFLQVSNGWPMLGSQIRNLLPIDEIEWLEMDHQEDVIDVWMADAPFTIDEILAGAQSVQDGEYFVYGAEQDQNKLRGEYLQTALLLNSADDDVMVLLNPQIFTVEGEWEAWLFNKKQPGARRYRSFWDLMHAEVADPTPRHNEVHQDSNSTKNEDQD